jgi:hypothetical protein
MTKADKKRLDFVERGMHALDAEQAEVKDKIEELLANYQETLSARGNNAEGDLVNGLKKLLDAPSERRDIPLRGPAPSKKVVKQLVSVQKNLGKIPKTNAKVK